MTDPVQGHDPGYASSPSRSTDLERRLHALESTIEAIAGLLAQAAELASQCAHPSGASQDAAGPEPVEERATIPVPAATRAFPVKDARGVMPSGAVAQAAAPEEGRDPRSGAEKAGAGKEPAQQASSAPSPALSAPSPKPTPEPVPPQGAGPAPTGPGVQAPAGGPVPGPGRGPDMPSAPEVPDAPGVPGTPGVLSPAARSGERPMPEPGRPTAPERPTVPAGGPGPATVPSATAIPKLPTSQEYIASEAEPSAFWSPPTEEDARDSRRTSWAREGNIGRHLLSGAAAILVTLAAVSLLIMVWDSIPDAAKIGALGVVAIALVTAGTRLGSTRPRLRVAAATLTGTGGVLGFVALIGAEVLHLGIPLLLLMLLMMGWALFLLVLSSYSRQFFTAIISTLGALTTMGFVVVRAHGDPSSAGMHGLILVVYALLLAATASWLGAQGTKRLPAPAAAAPGSATGGPESALGPFEQRLPVAAWYPATSLVVLAFVLLFDVPSLVREERPFLWIVLNALTWLAAQAQCLHLGLLLSNSRWRELTGSEWLADALITAAPVLKALVWHDGTTKALLLIMIGARTALALGLFAGMGPGRWRGRCAGAIMPGAIIIALGAANSSLYLTVAAAVVIGAASAAAARNGWALVVGLPALAGCALLVLPRSSGPESLCILLALGLCLAGTLVSERHMAESPSGQSALRLALAATVVGVVITLSARVSALIPDLALSLTVAQVCATLTLCMLIAAGLTSSDPTPLDLLGFRRFGARGGVDESGGPSLPSPPAPSWIGVGALWFLAYLDIVDGARNEWFLQDALVSVAAVSAAAVASWLLSPWIGVGGLSLAIAIPDTLIGLGALAILTGSTASSLLMTVAILGIGGICILVGFRMNTTALRHYGLALVLLAVFKLALVDLSTRSSAMRVVSLAGAGVVCFLLSLAYNKLAEDAAPPAAPPAEPTAPTTAPGAPPSTAPSMAAQPPASGPRPYGWVPKAEPSGGGPAGSRPSAAPTEHTPPQEPGPDPDWSQYMPRR